MRLTDLVEQYIIFKQSLGMRYWTQSHKLRQFARKVGSKDISRIDPAIVRALF